MHQRVLKAERAGSVLWVAVPTPDPVPYPSGCRCGDTPWAPPTKLPSPLHGVVSELFWAKCEWIPFSQLLRQDLPPKCSISIRYTHFFSNGFLESCSRWCWQRFRDACSYNLLGLTVWVIRHFWPLSRLFYFFILAKKWVSALPWEVQLAAPVHLSWLPKTCPRRGWGGVSQFATPVEERGSKGVTSSRDPAAGAAPPGGTKTSISWGDGWSCPAPARSGRCGRTCAALSAGWRFIRLEIALASRLSCLTGLYVGTLGSMFPLLSVLGTSPFGSFPLDYGLGGATIPQPCCV